ncbi:SMI1/KNR4 family protein [Thalassiella azotivora]
MQERAALRGVWLPEEVIAWYAWHDGVDTGGLVDPSLDILPGFDFPSLEDCLDLYTTGWLPFREETGMGEVIEGEPGWPKELVPILGIRDHFAMSVVMYRAGPVDVPGSREPAELVRGDAATYCGQQKVPSLVAFIELWMGWLNDGLVTYSADRWDVDMARRHRSTWTLGLL